MNTRDNHNKKHKGTRVIAVTSGKGGVGKTNVSINLAIQLAELGNSVTLLDADLGLANVDVLLNLRPLRNLSHVLQGDCTLSEIVIPGPHGVQIIPASSGVKMMSTLTARQQSELIHAFSELDRASDVLIVDTSAGLNDSVVNFCTAAHEVLLVVCDEPASVADAYAMIKVLRSDYGIQRFRILANMVQYSREGQILFDRLSKVSQKYLDVVLHYSGVIPRDPLLVKAVRAQQALSSVYPTSPAAMAFKELAKTADNWVIPDMATGRLEFFVERVIQHQSNEVRKVMP